MTKGATVQKKQIMKAKLIVKPEWNLSYYTTKQNKNILKLGKSLTG